MTQKTKAVTKRHTQPQVIRAIAPLRAWVLRARDKAETVALVPTMGALHKGHLALVRLAKRRADRVVVSIFVNPAQFAPNEDFSNYPRTWDADIAALSQLSVDAIWAPGIATMYPDGFATRIMPGGPALAGLEDKFRPHFFGGVCTVVAKLLLQVAPDFVTFGDKDYQQLKVVTAMARDLNIATEIVGVETERESDGMALSSRNRYLTKHERAQALAIYKNLNQAAERIRGGGKQQTATRAAARSLTTLGFKVDYVTARNAETLAVPTEAGEPLRLLAAAWLGKTRLIDNIAV